MSEDTPGFGRYRLGEEIGRGAMAIVHRAHDPRLGRDIAIKVLRPEFARAARHRRMFLTEAHAAGRLAHPGIVTVHDVGDDAEQPFMAMELLAGSTLQEILDRDGWLPAAEVVDIGVQLAEALDYAHGHGVIHRDIKPDNVVRVDDGLGVRLTDFGIARVREVEHEFDDPEVIGTPNYMAPEQVRGEVVDGRTDLYALGVLMYALLAGRTPFERDSVQATLSAIVDDPRPTLEPRDPATPPALVDMIATLMAHRPADRYQSGAELAEDLRQVARELDQRWQPRFRLPLRLRWPLVLGVVVAVTMFIGAFAVHQQQRAAMTGVVVDYGTTLAQTIAAESAEDLLLEDRVAIQATVEDMQRNRHMAYLSITDRHGEVIASTLPAEIGGPSAQWLTADPLRADAGNPRVFEHTSGDQDTFLFRGPIEYDGRHIGQIALAMPVEPLNAALRTSLLAMGGLFAAVLLAVLVASYIMARRLAIPLRLVTNALDQVAQGRFSYRIRLRRLDEFGALFRAYNRMGEFLQSRGAASGAPPASDAQSARPDADATDETREMTQPIEPRD